MTRRVVKYANWGLGIEWQDACKSIGYLNDGNALVINPMEVSMQQVQVSIANHLGMLET